MKRFLIPILILCIALVLLFAIRGSWDSWKSSAIDQTTDDAYVTSNQISLSTRITGTVKQVAVGDYQSVRAGQLVLELDQTDYKATEDEALAAVDAAKAQLAENQHAKRVADAVILSSDLSIAQAEAAVEAARAAIVAEQAMTDRATSEYRRQSKLLEGQATTHQEFEHALEARDSSQASMAGKRADLLRAQAAAASSRATSTSTRQQRAELDASDAAFKAQIRAKEAAATVTKVNVSYAKVNAPADGKVGKFQVHPGQLLSAGMQVVDFVQSGPWVEANYQETQLAGVRVGNLADITIDAYPKKTLRAYVAEIAPASGAATALLPPDNATGNFTKVVQRVPVKLLFENSADSMMLRPGLSAHVTIHTDRQRTSKEGSLTSAKSGE